MTGASSFKKIKIEMERAEDRALGRFGILLVPNLHVSPSGREPKNTPGEY